MDFEAYRQKLGTAVHDLAYYGNPSNDLGWTLWSLTVRAKEPRHEIWLCMGKRFSETGYEVAFHEGSSANDALLGFLVRMRAGDLKWHTDKWAPDKE